jgi:NADPH:quinone reductase-like Zn-dependent oxidoreductase
MKNQGVGKMRAVVYEAYGAPEVLHMAELDRPEPKEHEVLVRIQATAVNSGDVRLRKADPFAVRFMLGLFSPRLHVLGGVFSGTVVAVGQGVTRFKVDDEVFGSTDMRFGAYAEYRCFAQDGPLALKPANMGHAEAAVIPFGAATALHFCKQAGIGPGSRVLVYGASGAVGSAAVQLSKHFGAHVTAVCGPSNMDLMHHLGADRVLDHSGSFRHTVTEPYDVVWDTVNRLDVDEAMARLRPKGTLILSAAGFREMLMGMRLRMSGKAQVIFGVTRQSAQDMEFIAACLAKGALRPIIDRTYALGEMVEAHRYVEQGHKKGNVAIVV